MTSPERCAIYCRLSREDEEKQRSDSESIQNQKSMLLDYAAERGWAVYRLYCDEDYSGADADRPDFNRMLRDAEARRFQIILCKTQSRFTRDMELVERYIHGKFPLWGVRFVAIADHVDTAIRGNKKARQINGLVNEWYLEDLSDNIRMVFDHKRRQGQYIGSIPVYGYKKSPEDRNRLVVDEAAAEVVRQIFQWYREGSGIRQIAARLNALGLDNPTRYKQRAGLAGPGPDGGGLWNKTTVSRILRNEMYLGMMVQGRRRRVSYKSKVCADVPEGEWVRVPGTHQAIIDSESFRLVQQRLREESRAGETHPLSGLVRCGGCGGALTKTVRRGTGGTQLCYLRCKRPAGEPPACPRHSIRLDRLLELVTTRLLAHIRAAGEPEDLPLSDRELLTLAVERITVGKRDEAAGQQEIVIYWRF